MSTTTEKPKAKKPTQAQLKKPAADAGLLTDDLAAAISVFAESDWSKLTIKEIESKGRGIVYYAQKAQGRR